MSEQTTGARQAHDVPAPELSLAIPCYREAGHLEASVDALCEVLDVRNRKRIRISH